MSKPATTSLFLPERMKALRAEFAALGDTKAARVARAFARLDDDDREEALALIDRFVNVAAGPQE